VTDEYKGNLPRTFNPNPLRESDRLDWLVANTPVITIQDERVTGKDAMSGRWEDFPKQKLPVNRIAITGTMHSGKTTLANILVGRHEFNKQTFAGPVKDMAASVLNTLWVEKAKLLGHPSPWSDLTVEDLEKDKSLFRPLYQFIGAYGRQTFGEDFWVRSYRHRYEDREQEKVVCDDMRYLNEAEALRNRGYTLVRIIRPNKDRIASIKSDFKHRTGRKMKKSELKAILSHESEEEVPRIEVDHEIINDGSRDMMEAAIVSIMGGSVHMTYTGSQKKRGWGDVELPR
jgi:hypothetical protein